MPALWKLGYDAFVSNIMILLSKSYVIISNKRILNLNANFICYYATTTKVLYCPHYSRGSFAAVMGTFHN